MIIQGTGLASCECKNAYLDAYYTEFNMNYTGTTCGTIEIRDDGIANAIPKIVDAYKNGEYGNKMDQVERLLIMSARIDAV